MVIGNWCLSLILSPLVPYPVAFPSPQSPIPNPQSPVPSPQSPT
ncbi:hypothetical protein FDUTEX481_07780 [Tolypothrix sp. PCC 7601]|nr:hypothetical protein FDUTEX481_07780 [Tolypothrix sp. PCC 7601]